MHQRQSDGSDVRELRIEGFGLYVVGGLVVAALVGSFYLGRWIERASAPVGPGGEPVAGLSEPTGSRVESEPADVDQSATVFDRAGGEQQAEPRREMQSSPPQRTSPATRAGDFFVQVIALTDQDSAAKIVDSLRGKGYPVRLDSSRNGQSMVYKVRVGGYPTRGKADEIAGRLHQEGFDGAWVTQ